MNKKQYSLLVVLALVAGLVGGVVSSQFLMGQPAFAEKAGSKKVIKARRFQVMDDSGIERASFGLTTGNYPYPVLSIKDENGVIRLLASVLPREIMIQLIDWNKNPRMILGVNKDNIASLMIGGGIPPKTCGNAGVIAAGKNWTSMNILDGDCNKIWQAP